MTILHVTDFHFNKRWFDWLLHRAPPHDLVVMSGDMLDLAGVTPHRKQIAWVSDWLNDYHRPMFVCSGNHDLEWHDRMERWTPAYWLRFLANRNLWTDGQRIELNGVSILSIGCAMRPKGAEADIWVVHAPPIRTLVAAGADGSDLGDPDLLEPVRRYAPRLVLSGHVHNPLHWRDRGENTLFLNPGWSPHAAFPNHILVHTERLSSQLFTDADDGGGSKPDLRIEDGMTAERRRSISARGDATSVTTTVTASCPTRVSRPPTSFFPTIADE